MPNIKHNQLSKRGLNLKLNLSQKLIKNWKCISLKSLSQSVIRLLETTKQHFSVLTWKFRILHNFINKRTYLIIFKDEFKITLALDSL